MLFSKFRPSLTTIGRLLQPTHISIGQQAIAQRKINCLEYMPSVAFSQRVPGSNLDIAIKILKKANNCFYIKENGELLSSHDRSHMHIVQITSDGRSISRGICTTHPESNSQTFDVINLGPGTIENPASVKNQHFGRKKVPLELVGGAGSLEVEQSNNFLAEAIRLGNIESNIFSDNYTESIKVYQVELMYPQTIDKNFYRLDKDPDAQAFRNLVRRQAIEQISTGEIKEEDIVRVIGIKNKK